jgi:hypothetical protein
MAQVIRHGRSFEYKEYPGLDQYNLQNKIFFERIWNG